MTPEREAVARLLAGADPERPTAINVQPTGTTTTPGVDFVPAWWLELEGADRIIAERIAPLRSSLATAEREIEKERDNRHAEQNRRAGSESEAARYMADAAIAEARAASLEGLLTEARENQAASQRMTASVERSLDRSIALHEAAEALLAEAGKALKPFAIECTVDSGPFTAYFASRDVRQAFDTLTRIEAREGGGEKGRG